MLDPGDNGPSDPAVVWIGVVIILALLFGGFRCSISVDSRDADHVPPQRTEDQ